MPSYYEISPTGDALELKDGKGSAGFTVRYIGQRQVEAQAQAAAVQGADAEWLRVEEPTIRRMKPDQTVTFKVAVNVPKGTPPGRYGLRLNVMSVDNTDEEYDQGPVVTFEVPETEPETKPEPEPDPEKSGFRWRLLIARALIVLLGVGGMWWLWVSGDDPTGGVIRPVPVPPPIEEEPRARIDVTAAEIFREGTLRVRQTLMADLDEGTTGGRPGADIWFEARTAEERFITPRNGALVAPVGRRPPSPDRCAEANLSRESIPLERIPLGAHVCVRTNEGRLARFRVDSQVGSGPGGLEIRYTTWRRS